MILRAVGAAAKVLSEPTPSVVAGRNRLFEPMFRYWRFAAWAAGPTGTSASPVPWKLPAASTQPMSASGTSNISYLHWRRKRRRYASSRSTAARWVAPPCSSVPGCRPAMPAGNGMNPFVSGVFGPLLPGTVTSTTCPAIVYASNSGVTWMHTPQSRNGQGTSSPPMRLDRTWVCPPATTAEPFPVARNSSNSGGMFAEMSFAVIGKMNSRRVNSFTGILTRSSGSHAARLPDVQRGFVVLAMAYVLGR